jgi:hypothetical protein
MNSSPQTNGVSKAQQANCKHFFAAEMLLSRLTQLGKVSRALSNVTGRLGLVARVNDLLGGNC